MCGRLVITAPAQQLATAFDAGLHPSTQGLRPSWNVAPTRPVPALLPSGGGRVLVAAHWGFRAPWVRTAKHRPQPINARADKLTDRMFAVGFDFARVVLPVDGFYEWRTSCGAMKIPYFVHHADGERLILAAIASSWHDPTQPDTDPLLTVAIVTTDAGRQMRDLHDRQPVMLSAAEVDLWLDATSSRDELLRLTPPGDNVPLAVRQVSSDVNNVRNDHSELLTTSRFAAARTAASSVGVGQRSSPGPGQLRLRFEP
ncbi:MAG: SOS response-associated peptidase [Actinomycetota bacterium]|nr:SOS response-associated peptidase [Actinomycetota bacterium]